MGANNHPTVEPSNVDPETKAERLARDLESLGCTSDVEAHWGADNAVKFSSKGPKPGDIPADVIHMLAKHDAYLPRRADQSLDDKTQWWAAIHLG